MRKIEFVSYDGKYPNLCSGVLTLKVDGEEYSWNHCLGSGGRIEHDGNWNDIQIHTGPWEVHLDYDDLHHLNFTEEEINLITDLVNENVEPGCCGGCI